MSRACYWRSIPQWADYKFKLIQIHSPASTPLNAILSSTEPADAADSDPVSPERDTAAGTVHRPRPRGPPELESRPLIHKKESKILEAGRRQVKWQSHGDSCRYVAPLFVLITGGMIGWMECYLAGFRESWVRASGIFFGFWWEADELLPATRHHICNGPAQISEEPHLDQAICSGYTPCPRLSVIIGFRISQHSCLK